MWTKAVNESLWDLRKLLDVRLPEGLHEIGGAWFAGSRIRRVHVPASVQKIGEKAFYHCPSLRGVVIADTSRLEKVGDEAFDQSENLAIVYVPHGLECDMKEHSGCGFVIVRLPDPSKSIWGQTLGRLRKQRVLRLPNELEAIGRGWFANTNVETVVVPEGVREIQAYAFAGCEKLREVRFAEGSQLTTIWAGAFAMSGLERFVAPAGLRQVS